jgi:hypothetical protein
MLTCHLLVGNTMTNGTLGDGLCTNCNAAACPLDRGLAFASWYMRCNLINARELESGSVGSVRLEFTCTAWELESVCLDFARRAGKMGTDC